MSLSDRHGLAIAAAGKLAERVPGLRMIPIVRLILAAEILVLGKHHLDRLQPSERGQLVRLLAKAKGRPKNLTPAEQDRLADIVERLEPRLFLVEATDRISPVNVPAAVRDRMIGPQRRTSFTGSARS